MRFRFKTRKKIELKITKFNMFSNITIHIILHRFASEACASCFKNLLNFYWKANTAEVNDLLQCSTCKEKTFF